MAKKDTKKKIPMSRKSKPPMRESPKGKEPMDDKDKNRSIRIAIMMAKEMPRMDEMKGGDMKMSKKSASKTGKKGGKDKKPC